MKDDEIRTTLRLPAQLHQQLVELAEKNHVSYNSLVIRALSEFVDSGSGFVIQPNIGDLVARKKPKVSVLTSAQKREIQAMITKSIKEMHP